MEKKAAISNASSRSLTLFSSGPLRQSAKNFLEYYKQSLLELTSFDPFLQYEQNEKAELAATLLPYAAYIRRNNPLCSTAELFNTVKSSCLEELDTIIHN